MRPDVGLQEAFKEEKIVGYIAGSSHLQGSTAAWQSHDTEWLGWLTRVAVGTTRHDALAANGRLVWLVGDKAGEQVTADELRNSVNWCVS
jgi:hypothetical protein